MGEYYRITKGLNSIGELIPVDANPYDYVKEDKDYYVSVYKYTEDHKKIADKIIETEKNGKKVKRKAGVAGIEDVTTNKLIFDVDNPDLKKSQKDAITICERLVERGLNVEDLNISFSGGKGFSITVTHDQDLTPAEHKRIAKGIAGDLETFDTKNYNASRVFRLDGTKHNVSGLYKTPLQFEELKSSTIDQIKDIAKQQYDPILPKKVSLTKGILELKTVEIKETKESTHEVTDIDFSKKPYYLTDVKYALHQGYIPPGDGNTGMMILAATYKHLGFDRTDSYHMLKGVNEKRAAIYGDEHKRDNDEIWTQVISTVYSPSWNGGTYASKHNELLQETAKKFNITEKTNIVSITNVKDRFINFSENINKNIIRTGIKSLDDNIMITTGMMVGLLGAPSSGKTSFATSFMENLAKNDQTVLFQSLDMHDSLLYQRLIQKESGIDIAKRLRQMIESDESYNPDYKLSTDDEVLGAMDKVEEKYKNVEFNFTRGATIESIEEDIRANKAKHGDNLKLVIIDYLEKVRGPYSDSTANSGFVASRLSDLASTYDVAILLLLQPQKSAGDPSEELLSMRKVKGASVIEQDCRVILTMWRPGFNPKNGTDDKYASVAVVKNNMGNVLQLDYAWDGLKGGFKELNHAERQDLQRLREEIKEEKEMQKRGYEI